MRAVALAIALTTSGCAFHLHPEEARLRPAILSYNSTGDNPDVDIDGGGNYLRVHDLVDRAGHTPVGLRLTVPFDLGWDGPPRGPRWVHDPGYPTGPYAAGLVGGRVSPKESLDSRLTRACRKYGRLRP